MAVSLPSRVAVTHPPGAPPQERELVERVAADVESFENGIGTDFKERCEKYYKQYRGFQKYSHAWKKAGANDRDGVVLDATKQWGANLHVPMSFRTIETMVPRAVAQRPQMQVMPRQPQWEHNVDSVRYLLDAQQGNIDIDLPFQAIMRSGRIYGIGFGKAYWRKEYARSRSVKRGVFRPDRYVVGNLEQRCTFDDPDFEDLDVFDVMWDPMGSAMRGSGRAKWVIHRVWLSLEDCLERLRSGVWGTESARALLADPHVEDKLRGMGNGQKYSEVWATRMEASGFNSFHLTARGEHIHEVWEWHDGDRVLTVLDRQVLVQDAENPCVGQLPFQCYRPTPLQKQMVGIGDMEPVEHLQRELDTLRSQKRDFSTIALCAGYAFDDAYIDEEDVVFGPASLIRVRNAGDIRNALMPLPVREMPGSAIQDEQIIRQDFELVTGISDAMEPGQGNPQMTATGAMLAQASLSARIELGSRRFEIEVVRNAARTFLALNQRMILAPRDSIRLPEDGISQDQAAAEGRWQWFPIDPGALRGEFEIVPEGGSMAAKNIPQDRQDAVQAMQLFGQHPLVESSKPLMYALKKYGVDNPESWLKQQETPVPPKALQMLEAAGVDRALIEQAVAAAQREDPMVPSPEEMQEGGQGAAAAANQMEGSG